MAKKKQLAPSYIDQRIEEYLAAKEEAQIQQDKILEQSEKESLAFFNDALDQWLKPEFIAELAFSEPVVEVEKNTVKCVTSIITNPDYTGLIEWEPGRPPTFRLGIYREGFASYWKDDVTAKPIEKSLTASPRCVEYAFNERELIKLIMTYNVMKERHAQEIADAHAIKFTEDVNYYTRLNYMDGLEKHHSSCWDKYPDKDERELLANAYRKAAEEISQRDIQRQLKIKEEEAEEKRQQAERDAWDAEHKALKEFALKAFEPFTLYHVSYGAKLMRDEYSEDDYPEVIVEDVYTLFPEPNAVGYWLVIKQYEQKISLMRLPRVLSVEVVEITDPFQHYGMNVEIRSKKFEDLTMAYRMDPRRLPMPSIPQDVTQ